MVLQLLPKHVTLNKFIKSSVLYKWFIKYTYDKLLFSKRGFLVFHLHLA